MAKGPGAEILTLDPIHPDAGAEMLTEGGACTVTFVVAGNELQPAVVTTKLAVAVPAFAKLTFTGPEKVEVDGLAPAPKLHA
jgi:hypothetical protein